jgi:hypothetical protein
LAFNLHRTRQKSCVGPSVNAWFCVCPMILFFLSDFKGFFHYVTHSIGPPSSLSPWFIILHLWSTFGPFGHPPSRGGERTTSHDVMQHHLASTVRDARFMFYVNKLTFFQHLLFGLCINGSILWFWWMMFRHWLPLSSLSPLEQIWFHKQPYLMGLLLQLQLFKESLLSWLIPNRSISSFNHRGLWVFAWIGLQCFHQCVNMT